MTAENETVIFTVKLNESDMEKRLTVLRASLAQLLKERTELDKSFKAGSVTAQQYADNMGTLGKAIGEAKEEIKTHNRQLQLQKQAHDAADGSVKQLRANVGLLTTAVADLSKEDRENTEAGKMLVAQLGSQLAELKQVTKAYGDHRLEVGNYSLATQQTNKHLAAMQQQGKKTSDALSTLDNTFGVFGGQLEGIKSGLQNAKAGLEATKLGLVGVRGAIAATGIGVLLIALGTLYAWLTKSQEGMDWLERKTAAVGKVFALLTDKAAQVGGAIMKAFENPKQALKELGTLLKDNLINRFTALYEIGAAVANLDFTRLVDGAIQLGTGIEGATDKARKLGKEVAAAAEAGERLAATNQKIRRDESDLTAERAKSRAEVERLKKASEDVTKSTTARAAAAKQAYDIENGLLQRQLALQQRKIDAVKAEYKGRETLDEARDKINEAQAQYYELEEESLGKQTELQNSLNGIRQEGADKAKQQADAAKAAALEALQLQQQVADKRLQIAQLRGQDTLALEEDAIRKAAAVEIAQAGKSATLRELIAAETEAKILTLRVQKMAEAATLEVSTRKAGLEAQLALVQEGSSTELRLRLALIRANAETERTELEANATQTVEGRRLLAAQLAKVDAEARAATEQAERSFVERQQQQQQEAADKEVALRKYVFDRIGKDRAAALADQQAGIEAELATVREGSKAELRLRIAAINNRRQQELLAENLTANARKKINADADAEIEDERRKRLGKIVEMVAGYVDQAMNITKSLIEANTQSQLKALDDQQAAALNAAGVSADQRVAIEKKYAKQKEAIEREAAKKRKIIAIAEAVISTAKAVVAAYTIPIVGPVLAAIAAAIGAAQIAVISSQQFAKGGYVPERKGGYVVGPGTGTSDSIPARISNGESIITAAATQKHYNLLSAINQEGGGVAFPGTKGYVGSVDIAAPAVRHYYAQGGVAQSGSSAIDYDLFAAKIAQYVGPAVGQQVLSGIQQMPAPVVGVEEITNVANRVQVRSSSNDS
jgi:hypothetical protein